MNKIVSPYRPMPISTVAHANVGPFDWVDALRMLRESGQRVGLETFAVTTPDAHLGVPAYVYPPTTDQLTVWIVEACLRYLESDDFDADTAMLSPDMLVFADPFRWLTADLVMVGRLTPKYMNAGRPLLFGAQLWSFKAKRRLIKLYQKALEISREVAATQGMWGADIEPFLTLFAPLREGRRYRSGLTVRLLTGTDWMVSLPRLDIDRMDHGLAPTWPSAAIVDFKYRRKQAMRAYFDATLGVAA